MLTCMCVVSHVADVDEYVTCVCFLYYIYIFYINYISPSSDRM